MRILTALKNKALNSSHQVRRNTDNCVTFYKWAARKDYITTYAERFGYSRLENYDFSIHKRAGTMSCDRDMAQGAKTEIPLP